jgi:hypothetical protein
MGKKAAAVRTTRINRPTPAPAADLERYCRGLNDWPRSWMGEEKDVPPGEKLVACFRPFLEYLVAFADLSPKTIQKHVDHLWVLGGEIIRDLNETPSLRKKPIEQILFDVIDEDWRSADLRRQLRATTAVLRLHVPQVSPLPRFIRELTKRGFGISKGKLVSKTLTTKRKCKRSVQHALALAKPTFRLAEPNICPQIPPTRQNPK